MYTVNHYNVNRLKEYIDIQTKLRFYWKIIYIHFQENYFFGNNIRNRKNCWQPFFPVPCTCLLLHSPRCAAASPPRPAQQTAQPCRSTSTCCRPRPPLPSSRQVCVRRLSAGATAWPRRRATRYSARPPLAATSLPASLLRWSPRDFNHCLVSLLLVSCRIAWPLRRPSRRWRGLLAPPWQRRRPSPAVIKAFHFFVHVL